MRWLWLLLRAHGPSLQPCRYDEEGDEEVGAREGTHTTADEEMGTVKQEVDCT